MDNNPLLAALRRAQQLDQLGYFKDADRLTNQVIRLAQTDENILGALGNGISNGAYAVQNWGANAFLGGGQNAQRMVGQIDYFIRQMQNNQFLRDPNQKATLMDALYEARQMAYSLTSDHATKQQQTQQSKEVELAAQYLAPQAGVRKPITRTADDRSIPVVINDIQNLINFARQAYADRDQQQVSQLVAALNRAKSAMYGQGYTPAPYSPTGLNQANYQSVALDPTNLNPQQKQFLDKYMQIGIARGRDEMLREMNANPWHTEPFKQMTTKFWDELAPE